jgi:hypothetical protein
MLIGAMLPHILITLALTATPSPAGSPTLSAASDSLGALIGPPSSRFT